MSSSPGTARNLRKALVFAGFSDAQFQRARRTMVDEDEYNKAMHPRQFIYMNFSLFMNYEITFAVILKSGGAWGKLLANYDAWENCIEIAWGTWCMPVQRHYHFGQFFLELERRLLLICSVIFELCFLRDGSSASTVLMARLHSASLFREKMLIFFDLALISPFMFQFLCCYNAHQRILHHTLGMRRKRVIFEYSW